jgi:hypothetical protein
VSTQDCQVCVWVPKSINDLANIVVLASAVCDNAQGAKPEDEIEDSDHRKYSVSA